MERTVKRYRTLKVNGKEISIPVTNKLCFYCKYCTFKWGQQCSAGYRQGRLKYVCIGFSEGKRIGSK